jgi:hypothetical protein
VRLLQAFPISRDYPFNMATIVECNHIIVRQKQVDRMKVNLGSDFPLLIFFHSYSTVYVLYNVVSLLYEYVE